MEKDRVLRMVSVVALVVAVLGVTIGFAAWSATLKIMGVQTSVGAGQDDEVFKNKIQFTNVTCAASGSATAADTGYGSISGTGFVWENAAVGLTKQGDSVTCTGTISNSSKYIAYFSSIEIGTSNNFEIGCDFTDSTGSQGLAAACDALKLSAWIADDTTNVASIQGSTATNRIKSGITGLTIPAATGTSPVTPGTNTVKFKIEYAGSDVADGPFTATLPDITFGLSSVSN